VSASSVQDTLADPLVDPLTDGLVDPLTVQAAGGAVQASDGEPGPTAAPGAAPAPAATAGADGGGGLEPWVDRMHGGLDAIQERWYRLHDEVRHNAGAYAGAINEINGTYRRPIEEQLEELEAGGGPQANQLALYREEWERRFAVILSLQTYRGEAINGAIRVPTLMDGTTQSHQLYMAGRVRAVGEAYERIVRVRRTREEAQAEASALDGNAFLFLRELLIHTGAHTPEFTRTGPDHQVIDSMPPPNAWEALFPDGRQRTVDTSEARAEAAGEDAGVTPERTAVIGNLADLAANIAADWEMYAALPDAPAREAQLIRNTLESDAEVDAFLDLVDARGDYDAFMTAIPRSLRAHLLRVSGRTANVDLLEARRQATAELFEDMASNVGPAFLEGLAGFYRGMGDMFSGLGVDFLGDVMKDAGEGFDGLAGEMDNWLGNTDTELRSTIAHLTGNVEARLFQVAVGGEVGTLHAMVQMGGDAAELMSLAQEIYGAVERGGRWLKNAGDRLWRIRAVAGAALRGLTTLADPTFWEGKTSDQVIGEVLEAVTGELGGLLELPTERDERRRGREGQVDAEQSEQVAIAMALGETGFDERLSAANTRVHEAVGEYEAAAAAIGDWQAGGAIDGQAFERVQQASRNLQQVRAEVEGELTAAADEFNRAREAHLANLQAAVAAGAGGDEENSVQGLFDLLRSLWESIIAVARAALAKLVEVVVQQLHAYATADSPPDAPELGTAAGEAAKAAAEQLWDEIADPITGQIIDWIGDLVGRVSELAEIGAEALLEALWEELGGDVKDWVIDEKLGSVWTGISDEVQRDFEAALGIAAAPETLPG